jgi:hypothetical protein
VRSPGAAQGSVNSLLRQSNKQARTSYWVYIELCVYSDVYTRTRSTWCILYIISEVAELSFTTLTFALPDLGICNQHNNLFMVLIFVMDHCFWYLEAIRFYTNCVTSVNIYKETLYAHKAETCRSCHIVLFGINVPLLIRISLLRVRQQICTLLKKKWMSKCKLTWHKLTGTSHLTSATSH